MMKIATIDYKHWGKEFNGDLDGALKDLDEYSATDFAIDFAILVATWGAFKAAGVAGGIAGKTAAGMATKALVRKGMASAGKAAGIGAAASTKAFQASINRAKTLMQLVGSKKLAGKEARAYTKSVLNVFKDVNEKGYIKIGTEEIPLDVEMKGYIQAVDGTYRSGLASGEESALDLATSSLSRMQKTLEQKVAAQEAAVAAEEAATQAEAKAVREGYKIPTLEDFKVASKDAKHPYGRNPTPEEFEAWKTAEIEIRKMNAAIRGEFVGLDPELKAAANKTFDILGKSEITLTEDELLTAEFDVLVEDYAQGNNVSDDIIKKAQQRQVLRNEQIASREAAFNTQWETSTAGQEYLTL
jgi:hypothetical protein